MQTLHPHQKIRFADLLFQRIETTEGEFLGHVLDVQVTQGPDFAVKALLHGRYGLLHRLHVLHPFARVLGIKVGLDSISWDAVERFDHRAIIVRVP